MGVCCSVDRAPLAASDDQLFAHFENFVATHCELGHDKFVSAPMLISAFATYLTHRGYGRPLETATRVLALRDPDFGGHGHPLAIKSTFIGRARIPVYVSPHYRQAGILGIRLAVCPLVGIGLTGFGVTKEEFERWIDANNGVGGRSESRDVSPDVPPDT